VTSRRTLLIALLAAGIAPAQADAQDAVSDSVRELSCRALAASTVNAPDVIPWTQIPGDDAASLWPAAAPGTLPDRVLLRDTRDTFNARYQFATRDGQIFVAPRDGGTWRQMPLPACLAGRVAGISADDDELVALDGAGRIFTMDNALKGTALFNWSVRWGAPFWFGLGFSLPHDIVAWSWSVISPAEDKTFTDTAGNEHAAGNFKDSHIWALRPGGQKLSLFDPWLPLDESYAMCGPHRGRFRAINVSASGSTVFVIGKRGDLFTRLYDFDLAGHDPIFFTYSYEPQKKGDPNAAIQLPGPAWVRQPKFPGRITSAIAVEKMGTGAVHRTLRVEGLDASGKTGYWEKDVLDRSWRFVATGVPLRGRRLKNPQRDTSRKDEGRAADIRFAATPGDLEVEVPNFNVHCTPAVLRITTPGAAAFKLRLHNVDALRQSPRAAELDGTPREQYGTIEVPRAIFDHLDAQPDAVRSFVRNTLGGRRFTTVTLRATAKALELSELGWTLHR
jgi:hypothetical protein